MFVQTNDGLVVLKSGTKVVQELFGARLAQKLDILVPDARMIGYGDHNEWRQFDQIVRTVASVGDQAMFQKCFNRSFWLM
jgi:hypothetical protein